MLEVVHLSTLDTGGAGIAQKRLHLELTKQKIDSKFYCMKLAQSYKNSKIFEVEKKYIKPANIFKNIREEKKENFSNFLSSYDLKSADFFSNQTIIHLGWTEGFVNLDFLPENNLKFLTLHDMSIFTGGCNFSIDCDNYTSSCGKCPVLNSTQTNDLSSKIYQEKLNSTAKNNIKIIAPSNWIAKAAAKSNITSSNDIYVIPHGIDVELFKKIDSRDKFGISSDKTVILVGSEYATKRKGLGEINEILSKICVPSEKIVILSLGDTSKVNYNTIKIPNTNDQNIIIDCYNSADIFLNPTMQESFGLMTAEAMSCSLPVIAWDTFGTNEIITSEVDGYLAKPYLIDDIVDKLNKLILNSDIRKTFSNNARKKIVDNFSLEKQTKKHIDLYKSCIK